MSFLSNIFGKKPSERALLCQLLREVQQQEQRNEERFQTIMSAISEFAAKVDAHNAAIDAAVDGLTTDIKTLNDEIAALQASQGGISAEDQAALDRIEARGATIADKLTALDALTPPPPPSNP